MAHAPAASSPRNSPVASFGLSSSRVRNNLFPVSGQLRNFSGARIWWGQGRVFFRSLLAGCGKTPSVMCSGASLGV